eukprot:5675003-Pleurochrysis_carterae.AAC.1
MSMRSSQPRFVHAACPPTQLHRLAYNFTSPKHNSNLTKFSEGAPFLPFSPEPTARGARPTLDVQP